MSQNAAKFAPRLVVVLLSFLIPIALQAQTTGATLAGVVTDPAGKVVVNARISVKNVVTNQVAQTETNSAGSYDVANLSPGDYEVAVSAAGFDIKVAKVTLAAGVNQILNLTLSSELSLRDLGFPASQVQGNTAEQARLNKRSHMLQIHQRLGLITTIPLVATVITGAFAGGKPIVTSSTDRDLHAALGSATAGLYIATAYYAIFAPKIPGTKVEGPIRLHKALAWIHGPGMILTPILGAMAFDQRSKGERVHGIARLHGQVAIITAAAYGAAILSVSIKPSFVKHSEQNIRSIFRRHQPVYADALQN
ncbi:MAG: carboxypeptidase-like regulatory domain-containing protein [Candidatus Acidiferrales bacterium]